MGIVAQAVNLICGCALNQWLFKKFCDKIGAEQGVLLYHTQVRWPSCGSVFTVSILKFLKYQQSPLANHFEDEHFIVSLGFLADIFSLFNDLNTSMQGRDVDITQAKGKVVTFTRKFPNWSHPVLKVETWQTFLYNCPYWRCKKQYL